MKRRFGQQEAALLAYVQLRKLKALRSGDLVGSLRITPLQECKLLGRMTRAGMIARVRPGLYLVPPQLPLGGAWSPDETLALNTLMADRQGRYQICGPSAFSRYGYDEQVPTRVYAYNNRLSGERRIGAVALTLIEVADKRLGSTEDVKTVDGLVAVYSSRVRTLVDAVYDWSRFDSLPRGYNWIRRDLATKRVQAAELVRTTLRYGNQGTIRRIGVLLERERTPEALLRTMEKALTPATSLIPWIPNVPKRGKVNRRWGVVINGPH
jgi:predicted transcriptional regulator of viral defense system